MGHGAIIGSGIGGMDTIVQTLVPTVQKGQVRRLGSTVVEQVMNSSTSACVAGLLALGNQVTSNSSACSTGNEAIIESVARIRAGLAKRMLAGGSEGSSPYIWAGFDAMRVLCRKYNDTPEAASRPMSASAAGFVPGSGAGILVLEELESALEQGRKYICGNNRRQRQLRRAQAGRVHDGAQPRGGGALHPGGDRRCRDRPDGDRCDQRPSNGHLRRPRRGEKLGEGAGRGPDKFPFINSTKSLIGHCLGAAGAIECAAVVLQLYKGFLHPSVNCEDIHPDIEEYSDWVPRAVHRDAGPAADCQGGVRVWGCQQLPDIQKMGRELGFQIWI